MEYNLSEVDNKIYSCLNLENPKSFFLFAGAGSGKTGSLVKILQKFRDDNVSYLRLNGQKVAIITYTNAACDEIKRRLEFDSTFLVSTIHSFCWELIRSFQEDIKIWIGQNTREEISELELAQSKGKAGTKASIEREKKIIWKRKRLDNLSKIRAFTYNPKGTNSSRDSLNHAEVIKIASEFLDSKELMQKVLVRKYPILLVDESQDTKKELIEAFFKIQPQYAHEFSLGLFGDTMQRIYTDGKKDLGKNLPNDWIKPKKNINYRCPKRIITLINKIRGDQPQIPGENNEEGLVRLFIVDANIALDKVKIENMIANQMADFVDDADWRVPKAVKILTLEHKMAAKRGGFLNYFQPLYDLKTDNTGLIDGTMSGIPFFIQRLLPLVRAIVANNEFKVAELVKKYSPLLEKKMLSQSQSQLKQLRKAELAVEELHSMWLDNHDPLLIDVVKKVYDLELLVIPDILLPIVQRTDDDSKAAESEDTEDKNSDVDAWDTALKSPFSQLEAYEEYISDQSRFDTHQGVKGLEFPRVMVVLDDEDAGGFLFSYEKLLGAKDLSKTDLKNEAEGNETVIDRTQRLFYVTCSRAEKSLAIVAYTQNPAMVKDYALSKGWFKEQKIDLIYFTYKDNLSEKLVGRRLKKYMEQTLPDASG